MASSEFCTPNSVAFDRVLLKRGSIGRRDQRLRRENAGSRAACDSSCADKFGDRCFWVVLKCSLLRGDLNLGGPM
jgi:hypothetical protein